MCLENEKCVECDYVWGCTIANRKESSMDKLDENLLKKIEPILKITFYEWQKNYILDIPMVFDMAIAGRATGKTLVYVIKLLFKDDSPLEFYTSSDVYNVSDSKYHIRPNSPDSPYPPNNPYTRWFHDYLLNIYKILNEAGIKTRPVLYDMKPIIDDIPSYEDFRAKQILKRALNSHYGLMGTERKL